MGDDWRDEECLDYVDIFVVPPLASGEFREKMAKYGKKVRTPEKDSKSVYEALISI